MQELGKDCFYNMSDGTRDAVHVPIVIGSIDNSISIEQRLSLKPGDWVKFIDDKFTKFVPSNKEEGHGIIDPFVDEDFWSHGLTIILRPGITTPVRHNFEINPNLLAIERAALEFEVEQRRKEDPNCADCWVIRNREIIRM